MIAGSRIPTRIIALLAFLCLSLLIWTTFAFVVPFRQETGQAVLDTYIGGYDQSVAERMRDLLGQNETARDLLRSMYLGPELLFPALLAALLFLCALKLPPPPGDLERPRQKSFVLAALVVPFIYALADYAENIGSLVIMSDGASANFAVMILSWATRLKFLALATYVILLVRSYVLQIMRTSL